MSIVNNFLKHLSVGNENRVDDMFSEYESKRWDIDEWDNRLRSTSRDSGQIAFAIMDYFKVEWREFMTYAYDKKNDYVWRELVKPKFVRQCCINIICSRSEEK